MAPDGVIVPMVSSAEAAEAEFSQVPWSQPLEKAEAILWEIPNEALYFQYQLELGAQNSLRSPRVSKVTVKFEA